MDILTKEEKLIEMRNQCAAINSSCSFANLGEGGYYDLIPWLQFPATWGKIIEIANGGQRLPADMSNEDNIRRVVRKILILSGMPCPMWSDLDGGELPEEATTEQGKKFSRYTSGGNKIISLVRSFFATYKKNPTG